jgi:hypothetical protein
MGVPRAIATGEGCERCGNDRGGASLGRAQPRREAERVAEGLIVLRAQGAGVRKVLAGEPVTPMGEPVAQ